MNVKMLLDNKEKEVYTIKEDEPLSICIKRLNEKHIGVLVVTDNSGELIGLISERDVLRMVATGRLDFWSIPVKDAMTPREKLFTVEKEEHLDAIMKLMTAKRIRHIPVMDKNKFLGIVSIGDVVKNVLDDATHTNEQLKKYITGTL